MAEFLKTFVPMLLLMLFPIMIPLVVATVGWVQDRVRIGAQTSA